MGLLTWVAVMTRKYTNSVSSFLVANRCAGRYLIAVAAGEASWGAITVLFYWQNFAKTGWSMAYWSAINIPIGIFIAIVGWVVYRYRQTRAMTLAQFFEMRYSRKFRIFAGFMAWFSGVLNFGIFPAVAGRFFISWLNIPTHHVQLGGFDINMTLALVMAVLLGIALFFTFNDKKRLRMMWDGYDCGIAYCDQYIGKIISLLEEQNLYEDTAIIVSADHGENFGQLGLYAEHATADVNTCRIPMIIKWPGMKSGEVDKGLHYNLDLAPTLAELLGFDASPEWDGQSYADSLTKGIDCGREFLVLSQCTHVCQRSVRFDDWLYVKTYHDGWHLWPEEMLYNIKEDPNETNDVSGKFPDVVKQASYYYQKWHDRMMHTQPEGYDNDPMWTVIKEGGPSAVRGPEEYAKQLKDTGREWAFEELKKRYPQAWGFVDKLK